MREERPSVCFVVNPKSASGKTWEMWKQIEQELRVLVGEFEVKRTTCSGDGIALTRDALREGFDLIVSVGGDGTNNEVVNGFFDEEGQPIREGAMFSFFASGSGSDLQRSLPTMRSAQELADMILHGQTRLLDVGSLSLTGHQGQEVKRYFLNITSFGMSGMVTSLANNSPLKRISGKLAFHVASIRGFFGFPNVPLRIFRDDQEVYETSSRLGAVCNGRCFGGGMHMAPVAEMDDGELDLILLERFTLLRLLMNFGKIYKGTHVHLPEVSSHKVKKLRVESDVPNILMEVDGEVLGRLPLACEVLPKVLPFRFLPQEITSVG
ncbi:MAG: YegS/Rv2252/BmrU family lipid kinase [Myxococcales bacterium]|nr:YegS/Rv2252/BmrU family lipid kinase [Myxococcales bacterium]